MSYTREDGAGRKLVRKHIWLFEDDVIFLEGLYGGTDNFGFSKAVRTLLTKSVKLLRERAMEKAATTKHLENIPNVLTPAGSTDDLPE